MILQAVQQAFSKEVASPAWYDALLLSEEDAKFQRELDLHKQEMCQRFQQQGEGP